MIEVVKINTRDNIADGFTKVDKYFSEFVQQMYNSRGSVPEKPAQPAFYMNEDNKTRNSSNKWSTIPSIVPSAISNRAQGNNRYTPGDK